MQQKLQFVTTVAQPQINHTGRIFSGLDPVSNNHIKDEIYRLAKAGYYYFSTHRMEQVEEICDHIVLVNKGRKYWMAL